MYFEKYNYFMIKKKKGKVIKILLLLYVGKDK